MGVSFFVSVFLIGSTSNSGGVFSFKSEEESIFSRLSNISLPSEEIKPKYSKLSRNICAASSLAFSVIL